MESVTANPESNEQRFQRPEWRSTRDLTENTTGETNRGDKQRGQTGTGAEEKKNVPSRQSVPQDAGAAVKFSPKMGRWAML